LHEGVSGEARRGSITGLHDFVRNDNEVVKRKIKKMKQTYQNILIWNKVPNVKIGNGSHCRYPVAHAVLALAGAWVLQP